MRFRQSRPEFAKAFPLPADDCVGLDVQQGTTPARPQAVECDPKRSIKSRQNGPPTFSPECRQLQSQGSILEGNRLMTAQEQ
jgi:hypothetical protein